MHDYLFLKAMEFSYYYREVFLHDWELTLKTLQSQVKSGLKLSAAKPALQSLPKLAKFFHSHIQFFISLSLQLYKSSQQLLGALHTVHFDLNRWMVVSLCESTSLQLLLGTSQPPILQAA